MANIPATNSLSRFIEYKQYRNQLPAILDGGIATELSARGLKLHPGLWSSFLVHSEPDAVVYLHRDYYLAGADICTSCSYQMSAEGFKRELGWDAAQTAALLKKSVQLVAQARSMFWDYLSEKERENRLFPLVAASMSSYGASIVVDDGDAAYEFVGTYTRPDSKYFASGEKIKAFHYEKLKIFFDMDEVDVILFETIPVLDEAIAICELLEQMHGETYKNDGPGVIISFSCKDEWHTYAGDSIVDCAKLIEACPAVHGIGVNCTAPKNVASLVRYIRYHTKKIIACYPNSGEIWNYQKYDWDSPADVCERYGPVLARGLVEAGAQIVGGCCRTCPYDIAEISKYFHHYTYLISFKGYRLCGEITCLGPCRRW